MRKNKKKNRKLEKILKCKTQRKVFWILAKYKTGYINIYQALKAIKKIYKNDFFMKSKSIHRDVYMDLSINEDEKNMLWGNIDE